MELIQNSERDMKLPEPTGFEKKDLNNSITNKQFNGNKFLAFHALAEI